MTHDVLVGLLREEVPHGISCLVLREGEREGEGGREGGGREGGRERGREGGRYVRSTQEVILLSKLHPPCLCRPFPAVAQ